MKNELPEGWIAVPLGELLREPLRNGHSASASTHGAGVRTLTLSAVTYGDFSEKNTKLTVADPGKVADLLLQPGDILIERSNTPELVGTARLYKGPPNFAIFPDLVIRARLLPAALPEFVERELQSDKVRKYFVQSAQGTAGSMPKIDQGVVLGTRVRLAPLAEQRRIVAKIEALIAQVNAARGRLARVRTILKRFRQAVLAAACSGRLTEDWRGTHPQAEATETWFSDIGVRADDLPELPSTWRWTTMGRLLRDIEAGKSFACEERTPSANEVGVVKVSAVTWGEYQEEESKTCTDPGRVNSDLFIRPGDFLFSRANTIELVGACVIVKAVQRRVMLSDKILRLHLKPWPADWVLFALRSRQGRAEIERLATGNQQSMRNIGQDRIRQIRVPMPPLPEAEEAVRRVNTLLASRTPSNVMSLPRTRAPTGSPRPSSRGRSVASLCRQRPSWRGPRGATTRLRLCCWNESEPIVRPGRRRREGADVTRNDRCGRAVRRLRQVEIPALLGDRQQTRHEAEGRSDPAQLRRLRPQGCRRRGRARSRVRCPYR